MSKKQEELRYSHEEIVKIMEINRVVIGKVNAVLTDSASKGQVILAAAEKYRELELENLMLERQLDVEDKGARALEVLRREVETLRFALSEYEGIYGDIRGSRRGVSGG